MTSAIVSKGLCEVENRRMSRRSVGELPTAQTNWVHASLNGSVKEFGHIPSKLSLTLHPAHPSWRRPSHLSSTSAANFAGSPYHFIESAALVCSFVQDSLARDVGITAFE